MKPGEKAPRSGQYQQIGPQGEREKEVTVTKGKPLPPTPQKGMTYRLVDPTKNKSGHK
ncbi:MAG: YjzC family protein [Desulfobaccales bacterium]